MWNFFFEGVSLGQDTSEPQPSTGETKEDVNNVNYHHDMTEILLKAAENTMQSINKCAKGKNTDYLLHFPQCFLL